MTGAAVKLTEHKHKRITLFCVVTILYWFSIYTYVPTLSTYAKSIGASYKLVGIIIGSYGFTQMLLRIPLGIISDRLNRRKVFITMGVLLGFISSFGMWAGNSPGMLLVFRALAGAAAAAWVPFTVLFSSYYEGSDAPKAIGIISSISSFGQMAAIFLGGVAAQYISARSPFLLGFAGAVIGIVLSFGIRENTDMHRVPLKLADLIQVAGDKRLMLLSILAVLAQFMTFATMYGFTPVAARQIGASDFQLGLLTTISTMPGIFGAALSGSFFAKRVGEKRTLIWGFVISSVMCFIIPFVKSFELLCISQLVGGFCLGTVFPLLMGLCIKNVEDRVRATAMGFFQAIYGIGMFMGPTIVGFLSDYAGLSWGFAVIGVVGTAGAVISGTVAGRVLFRNNGYGIVD
jgi:MFS family permease